jgi:transposase-like protein
MAGKKTGRPTLLDEQRLEAITNALRNGAYIDHAAQAAGVSTRTYHGWMERGRAERDRINAGLAPDPDEAPFMQFLHSVERAQSEAAVDLLGEIANHARNGTWQAAAWILERKFPRQWGRFDRTEHTGPEGGPMRLDVSTEDLERKVQRIIDTRGKE